MAEVLSNSGQLPAGKVFIKTGQRFCHHSDAAPDDIHLFTEASAPKSYWIWFQ